MFYFLQKNNVEENQLSLITPTFIIETYTVFHLAILIGICNMKVSILGE